MAAAAGAGAALRRVVRIARAVPEVLLALSGTHLVPLIPRRILVGLARALGRIGFAVARRDRRFALANLDLAYGADLSAAEKRRIAIRSFQQFTLTLLEWFWFGRRTEKRVRSCIEVDDSVRRLTHAGAAIFVSAHVGNWEIIGRAAGLFGHTATILERPQPNPMVSWLAHRLRTSTGQELVSIQGGLPVLVKRLRDGGSVGMLLDQDHDPDRGGVFVDFFGVPVAVSKGAALLAARVRRPVVPVFCVPRGFGRYVVRAADPLDFDEGNGDVVRFTARIVAAIEDQVRAEPGAWLWMYKRWKRIRPGDDPGRYPFYARHGPARVAAAEPAAFVVQ